MSSRKPPTPRCDELRKAFDAFLATPPSSNVQWEGMVVKIEQALTELKTAGDTADAEGVTKLKAEVKRARESWNEGQKTR